MVLVVKNQPSNAGCKRRGFDSWARKFPWGVIKSYNFIELPGKRSVNPPQYSCLENPMDRGTWWSAVQGVAESQT